MPDLRQAIDAVVQLDVAHVFYLVLLGVNLRQVQTTAYEQAHSLGSL
jgi:hypothetical protein